MSKAGLTEIVCVVDRSGSMERVRDDAIGAFNVFLEQQKKGPGEALFSLTLFNTEYEMRHGGVSIVDVPPLTKETYVPGGMTALLDAVGKTIDAVGERFAKTNEVDRPERVLFAILTDGQENSSKEYTRQQVTERIRHQTDAYKWEFVFLAAGQQAFQEATQIGIAPQNISAYAAADPEAHRAALKSFSSNVAAYRGGKTPNWRQ